MTLEQGLNVIDEALALAVENLGSKGVPEQEAFIALLVRLWSVVPDEVAEIATMLRDDPELLSAMSSGSVSEIASVQNF